MCVCVCALLFWSQIHESSRMVFKTDWLKHSLSLNRWHGDLWPLRGRGTGGVPPLCAWPYESVLIFILMTFIPATSMIDQLCLYLKEETVVHSRRLMYQNGQWGHLFILCCFYNIKRQPRADSAESFFFLKALRSLNLCLGDCRCCHLNHCWLSVFFFFLCLIQ